MKRWLIAVITSVALSGCKIYTRVEGEGLVYSPDGAFHCQNNTGDCVQEYDAPTTQTLHAQPEGGSTFKRWNGCTYTGPQSCEVDISQDGINTGADFTVTAVFEPLQTQPGEATYTYNADGQRVTKTVEGITTVFQYDLNGNLLAELDTTGQPLKQHIYVENEPVAVIHYNRALDIHTLYYVHTDHLGTPSLISSESGEIVADYDSSPFGEAYTHYDEIDYNKRFPGQYHDRESGLNYNYYRDYDPSLGRYIQPDPIGLGDGINTYAYVWGNPLNYSDPFGLRKIGQPGVPDNQGYKNATGNAFLQVCYLIACTSFREFGGISTDIMIIPNVGVSVGATNDRSCPSPDRFSATAGLMGNGLIFGQDGLYGISAGWMWSPAKTGPAGLSLSSGSHERADERTCSGRPCIQR